VKHSQGLPVEGETHFHTLILNIPTCELLWQLKQSVFQLDLRHPSGEIRFLARKANKQKVSLQKAWSLLGKAWDGKLEQSLPGLFEHRCTLPNEVECLQIFT
jgi:hypothetical protein